MTLPRLRPTVRDHLKQLAQEFEKALETCTCAAIKDCKGTPTLSVQNSEELFVGKLLAGTFGHGSKLFRPGDVAPIAKRDYKEQRWEIVGDGDLFVECFRPHVIRLIREHLKAYREMLPDRESFCNSLDEIKRHLESEYFGAWYFSRDLQSEIDEWEERAWEGETRPEMEQLPSADDAQMVAASRKPETAGPRKRTGRKQNPEVAKRRVIVGNCSGTVLDVCKVLDFGECKPPSEWGSVLWEDAYRKDSATRQKIHSLIDRDRRANQKKHH